MRFSITLAFAVLAAVFVPAFTAPLRNTDSRYTNGAELVGVSDVLNTNVTNTPE